MQHRRKFLKSTLAASSSLLFLDAKLYSQILSETSSPQKKNPYDIDGSKVDWLHNEALRILKGCKVRAHDGTWLFTPDGVGHYGALWTRDLYYMIEYGRDLLAPKEVKEAILYLLKGQREDGCIPDRVNVEGQPIYAPGAPGKPLADHALDNGPFMAMVVCSYVNQHGDTTLFKQVESKVQRGLDQISLKENGLVYSDSKKPQCGYGFSDIVKKTGHLLFSSLLFYKANLDMYQLCKKLDCGNADNYKKRYEAVKDNINMLWSEEHGMFWAADIACKQIDIWASAYAVDVGLTSKMQTKRIVAYIVDHYDETVYRGQVRHLTGSEGEWEQLFIECKPGTYENGAYWALPLAWMLPLYDYAKPGLSKSTLEDVIKDFQKNGIHECINRGYTKLPDLVVSTLNVYSLVR